MAKARAIRKKAVVKPKTKRTVKRSQKTESHGSVDGLIPTERSVAHTSLDDYSVFMHGEKKIGKTSMWACDGDTLFLEFDPEQKALEIFQIQIPDWPTFQGVIKELKGGRAKDFKRVVIDGTEIFYQLCYAATCEREGFNPPEWAEWTIVKNDFTDAVTDILRLPIPVTFLSHSVWKEYKKRGEQTINKFVQNISGVAEEILVGPIDIWCAYTYDGTDRVILVEGDEEINAGHRLENQFRTTDGRAIREIPCGSSPQNTFNLFNYAFNNKQSFATLQERRDNLHDSKSQKTEGVKIPTKTKSKARN